MRTTSPVENGSGFTTSVAASTSESAWASSSPVDEPRWKSSGTARKWSAIEFRSHAWPSQVVLPAK